MSHRHIEIIPAGRGVQCDACGEDWTDRLESGGLLFGSYAYCPMCAKRAERRANYYGESHCITDRCPADMSFADWVRGLRGPKAASRFITIEE